MTFHPYHMVQQSPWPLMTGMNMFFMLWFLTNWFHFNMTIIMVIYAFFMCCLISYTWWRDIIRESTFMGHHVMIVKLGLKIGMLLFIISEVMFFFSFFWGYFHSSLSPDLEIGMLWPPLGINIFNPYHIPLLNTTILLSSGVTITWAHHSLLNKNFSQTKMGLLMTIILGFYFTVLQMFEYYSSSFSLNDSIFGSIFFVATGFHGLHVIIGSLFLFVSFLRLMNNHYSISHHVNFEISAWYWHFVDVVWLFLYTFVYWWIY